MIPDLSRQKKQSECGDNEQSLRELWDTMKHTITHVMLTPDEKVRKKEAGRIVEEIVHKNFSGLVKHTSLHIHEAHRTLRRINAKIHTHRTTV